MGPQAGSMNFVPKRPHRKSRKGCANCKRERVKCDECHPICGRCKKFANACHYTQPSAIATPPTSPSRPQHVVSEIRDDETALPKAVAVAGRYSLGPLDLELLHVYSTATSLTLSNTPDLQRLWQIRVPELAFEHDFLLHIILAFAALHLAYLKPTRNELLAEADRHHYAALELFRDAIKSITPGNCEACFIFSSIVAAYTCARSAKCLFFAARQALDTSCNVYWINLLRGVHAVLKAAEPWIAESSMRQLLQPRHITPELAASVAAEKALKLESISHVWTSQSSTSTIEDSAVLEEALHLLCEVYLLVESSATDPQLDVISTVYGWPIQVSEAFLDMVKERRPAALIVLAHYSLLLNKVEELWFMRGMSRKLLHDISCQLPEQWHSWIAWPLQELVLNEFRGTNGS